MRERERERRRKRERERECVYVCENASKVNERFPSDKSKRIVIIYLRIVI